LLFLMMMEELILLSSIKVSSITSQVQNSVVRKVFSNSSIMIT
jgi:hypothetical protein